MSKFESPLENIRIASPCQAEWNEMYGDNRKRFCGDCKLNVYNLSGMTRDEAETLIMNAEGRLCVRFYRRADGTVITQDCAVGWAKVKQRTRIFAAAFASMLMALFTGVLFASLISKQRALMGDVYIPFATPTPERIMGAIAIQPHNAIQGAPVMGEALSNYVPNVDKVTKFEMGKMKVISNERGG